MRAHYLRVCQRFQHLFSHAVSGVHNVCAGTNILCRLCAVPALNLTSSNCVTSCHGQRRARSSLSRQVISSDNTVNSHLPDIDIPAIPFQEHIFKKCDEFKDRVAMQEFLTGKSYTYGQLKENVVRVASALHRQGFRKGDVILVFSTNHMDFTVLMLACACCGLPLSAANPSFKPEELSRQISHSEAVSIFTLPELAETVSQALQNPQYPHKVTSQFVFGEHTGMQPFQNLLEDDGKAFPDVSIDPLSDIFTLPYSSGTSGLPKGVMLTHYSCLANVLQIRESMPIDADDYCLGLLPLFHIYGMIVVQYNVLNVGSRIVYLPKFEPETFLRCIQDQKITFAHLVPPLVVFLTKHPMVSDYDVSSLKALMCGAAPLGEDLTKAFLERHNNVTSLNQGYGLTETSPVTNLDTTCQASSIGNLLVNTLGKIVDLETNKALGPMEVGELCFKGPQVMKGYLKNPEATDEMIDSDGWLHSGDIGYFDKNGRFYIQDRLKELIKYKGSQVAPAELEALLLGHPDIQDVAVTGVPDISSGELPKAFVVKKPGSNITENEIVKFVEERVSHIKRLRGGVEFIDEVPKNPSGKILRRILRARFQ